MLRDIIAYQPPGPDASRFRDGARFEHAFQGDLENASLVSSRLRLTRCVEPDGSLRMSVGPCYLNQLVVAPEDFERFIQDMRGQLFVEIGEVLAAFVGATIGHCALLPAAREPFAAPTDHRAVLGQLALHGYAEKVGDDYRWTDRMGPAMRECYLWTEDLQDLKTVHAAELLREAEAALAGMPDLLRARLARSAWRDSEFDFVREVARHWDGEAWRMNGQPAVPDAVLLPSRVIDFARCLRGLILSP